MTAHPGFHAEHLREQPRRLALRNIGEIGDKGYGIAALVSGGEIAPTPVEAVHLERSKASIGPARVQRDKLTPNSFASRQELVRTAGKAARAA